MPSPFVFMIYFQSFENDYCRNIPQIFSSQSRKAAINSALPAPCTVSDRLASDDSRIGITTTVENNSKNLAHESSLPRYTNRTMSNKRSSITVVTSRNRILLILILSGFIKLSRLDTTFIQATLKRYNTEYHFCLQYRVSHLKRKFSRTAYTCQQIHICFLPVHFLYFLILLSCI